MRRENGFLEIIGIVANEDTHYSLSLRGPTGLQLEIRMMSSTRALISRGLVRAELLVPPGAEAAGGAEDDGQHSTNQPHCSRETSVSFLLFTVETIVTVPS